MVTCSLEELYLKCKFINRNDCTVHDKKAKLLTKPKISYRLFRVYSVYAPQVPETVHCSTMNFTLHLKSTFKAFITTFCSVWVVNN